MEDIIVEYIYILGYYIYCNTPWVEVDHILILLHVDLLSIGFSLILIFTVGVLMCLILYEVNMMIVKLGRLLNAFRLCFPTFGLGWFLLCS
ncbi:hypothetical protein PanWU01x14_249480 [Parasponia andersonii]|uniref:Transmembrane protein n=1 Tax=Parasponia andersonii TaxID=3476 RepID=A0A2P5BD92_PARAD|nr:hypothetical protein PanWU01x14_249480 [Parasponia andersonii]